MNRVVVVLLGAALAASSCSPNQAPARGRIADVGGKVVRVADTPEGDEVCATHECEPNYVYQASFGKPKPRPTPTPIPTPTPTPSVTPRPSASPSPAPSASPVSGDRADYSRSLLKLPEAWRITEGSREVIVAVIDTGAQLDHPDLRDNLWINAAERNGRPGVDDDGNGYIDDVNGWDFVRERPAPSDDNEHGTHVAGVIAAARNGVGIVGVAPRVRILPLKFLDESGSGDTADAIRAIDYAVKAGARVINNSWGGYGRSELLNTVIQRAIAAGVIVVAAAGNEEEDVDQTPFFPATFTNVISVASSDKRDELSWFSNYGDRSVTVVAPGSDILSAVPGSKWKELSGTSMAAPQVAGALALAVSLRPALTPAAARDALCRSARGILLSRVTCGRLDVLTLLQAVE